MADHDPMQPVGSSPLAPNTPLTPDEIALLAVTPEEIRRADEAAGLAPKVTGQEIAEMREALRFIADLRGFHRAHREIVLPRHIAERLPRLLDSIEALTAKNQRLTDALTTAVHEACEEIDDNLKPEIERLTAENATISEQRSFTFQALLRWQKLAEDRLASLADKDAEIARLSARLEISPDHPYDGISARDETIRQQDKVIDDLRAENTEIRLQCLAHETQAHEAYEAQKRAEAEAIGLQTEMEAAYGILTNSLMAGFVHGHPTVKELQERIYRATAIIAAVIFGQPKNWYDTQRRRVEADHAATEAAKRQAECRNCRDGRPAYVDPSDWDTCPGCGKKFGAASKEGAQ